MSVHEMPVHIQDGPIRILGIGGSVRQESITRKVLEHMLETAAASGAETMLADVHSLNFPVYNEEIPLEEQPESLRALLEDVKRADAFILCSPTYHGSISGAFKNVLDALHIQHGQSRTYFDQRPVGLAAYGGPSAINVINALTHTARSMRGLISPTTVTVAKTALDESQERIADAVTMRRVHSMIGELMTLANAVRMSESRMLVS